MQDSPIERRRAQRLPMTLLMRVSPSERVPTGEDTVTRDVSPNGVYFITRTAWSVSAEIEFVLALPPMGIQVRYKGKVVRAEPCPDGTYGVAVSTEAYEYLGSGLALNQTSQDRIC